MMRIPDMKPGEDYLVSDQRDWVTHDGRRMRWTGEVKTKTRSAFNHGWVPVVEGAEMRPVLEDGLGQPEIVNLAKVKVLWSRGSAAVQAYRGEMDEEERADLAERDRLTTLAAAVSAPGWGWQGRHEVTLQRADLEALLARIVQAEQQRGA